MRHWFLILLTVLFAAAPIAAHAGDVQTDYDHSVVWERYRTFSFGHIQSKNPFYVSRIRDGLTHYLTDQGWQHVAKTGDATIFVDSNVRNQRSLRTFYSGYGGGWGWGGWPGWGGGPGWATTQPVDTRVRIVVVDIYDTHTKKLLWRGTSRDDLSDNSEKNTRALYVDFADMFHKFPPKP